MSFKQILNVLNPQPEIGGLKISDLNLRYIKIKGDKLITAALRMPPGLVKGGKVADSEKFTASLAELHSQITDKQKKKINVVITIPDDNVYIQAFGLPILAAANLEEAVKLNLQMISPIDFNNAYSDWEKVGESGADGKQIEILSAFIQKDIVDNFEKCFKAAGFSVAAIECPALSLSRLAIEWGTNIKSNDAYILLQVGTNGLGFNVIEKERFYFNHFVSWQSVYGDRRQVSFDDFKNALTNEAEKVLKFYETHRAGQIKKLILVSPRLHREISQILSEKFGIEPQLLTFSSKKFSEMESVWFSALGSALRGLIPRAKDTIISLASVGTEKEFRQQEALTFIRIWRNIVFSSLILCVIIFLLADGFLIKTISSLNEQLALTKQPEVSEFEKLQQEAAGFNRKIDLALGVRETAIDWPAFLEKIKTLAADNNVKIQRIFVQSAEAPIMVSGQAGSEEIIIAFKNVLLNQPQFKDIDLPLTSFVPAGGAVNFTISFRWTPLK
jgi:Tfp pilus assembly PilM family ATPase